MRELTISQYKKLIEFLEETKKAEEEQTELYRKYQPRIAEQMKKNKEMKEDIADLKYKIDNQKQVYFVETGIQL